MKAKQYSITEIREALARRAEECGGIRALGRQTGIDHAHLWRIIKGRNNPGAKVLNFLNFKPVVVYVRDWNRLDNKLGV